MQPTARADAPQSPEVLNAQIASRKQAVIAEEVRVVSQEQEVVAEEVRAVGQHQRVEHRPLVVRTARKIARLVRNFVQNPRKFVRSVVRRRLVPAATRVSSFLVRHEVVTSVRDQRTLPDKSIVAVLGAQGVDKLLATSFEQDTELVLLVDGRDRAHVARWLSEIRARRCRLYLFDRTRPIDEMLRYGLSRAYGKRIAVLPRAGHVSRRSLAAALAKLPEDSAAFVDTGELLVLRHHAAREVVTGRDVREGLATAFASICGTGDDQAPDNDRTEVFFYARHRYALLADQLLVGGDELDRKVVYGRDPQPLLDLLARQGDEAVAGLKVMDTREMPGHFVYRAPPPTALFAEPAKRGGIVCFERRPPWFRLISGQVGAVTECVTVIMTVYNDAATLDAAIDSILEQSYRNLELIVVDDGSTDGSLDIVRRKMSHDGRIHLLRTPANSGTYVAKNLGMVHATGEFVAFQDADDVSLAHRIELQVAAMHSDPTAIANMLRYQRLSEDTGRVLWIAGNKDRAAAISLMFRRQQVLDTIGFFDSVRVTADSEFIERLAAATGQKPQILPMVGYVARHAQGSLTTSGAGEIKLSPDGAATLPPARVAYWNAAQQWHRDIADGTASPYVSFPLRARPFPAPEEIVPASWAGAYETVTASVATMPERVELLAQAIGSLLPQVDRMQVYLNNFDDVPAFLDHPKITVQRSQDFGDLKDNGKFFGVDEIPEGYHFTVDDDIIYPPDYVQKSVLKIEQYERRVAVGMHGVNLADPLIRYTKDRRVAHFKRELPRDEFVQLLGTGTLAYHTSTLRVAFDDFRTTGVADLWFAIQARRQGVGLLAQARPAGWLQPIEHDGDTIFDHALKHDDDETAIARQHGPWTADAMAGIWRPLARYVLDHHPVDARTSMDYNVNQLTALAGHDPIHFTLIVPGWNCANHVKACWRSIERQRPGHYTREVYFVDDASTDGTWDALTQLSTDDDVHLVRNDENRGPAHARYSVLERITDPNRVCVLLDLDDELAPEALWRLAEVYLSQPRIWLTCGSWRDQNGRGDGVEFYDQAVLHHRAYRDLPLFKCTHLRSFRRFLCDPLGPEHFQDPAGGGWLQQCTDVALMLPLLEQCAPENIVYLHDELYRYRRRRDTGTIHRFGKDQKLATYHHLCRLPRMPARSVDAAPMRETRASASEPVGGETRARASASEPVGGETMTVAQQ
jgi:glycosyltransferase involved in cell wall biosynthesis